MRTPYWTPGVGRIPKSTTSQPEDKSPAFTAYINIGLLVLVSPPTATVPWTTDP